MKRISAACLFAFTYCAAVCGRAADARADFLNLIRQPPVPMAAEVEELPATNGLAQFHFSFASDAAARVPGILLKPAHASRRLPVVIALHGTGGSKNNMLALCRKLANEGFLAVAMDGRYHGERAVTGRGSADYEDAIVRAWRHGGEHPLYFDTVHDVMRLVDYLKTRQDADSKRIGLIGISKGGIETYLAAAADTRIAAAVSCIGAQSFHWELEHDAWQARVGTIQRSFDIAAKEAKVAAPDAAFAKSFFDRVAPGIDSEFDGPAMLPLIAPRPLLIINGEDDVLTPLAGLKVCTDAAQAAYRAARAEDHFAVRIQKHTRHQVRLESEQAAIEWFVKWLKP